MACDGEGADLNTTLRDTDVAILCGGLGTRLGLRTRSTPKFLVPVAGRPFADYLMRFLERHGATRVLLLSGHLSEPIMDWMVDGAKFEGDVELIRDPHKLGTAGALRHARLRLRTDHVLVCNGDTLTTASLPSFVSIARECEYHVADLMVRRFGHEGKFHSGFTLLNAEALDLLAQDDETDFVAWRRWRSEGVDVGGQYLDLGDPRQYQRAQRIFPLWEPLS
jgi:CTP:molybdopterin cytidylyltransferase MocA